MKYKKIYTNYFLKLGIFSNSKTIAGLVDNFLDFNGACNVRPKIEINFYLHEIRHKSPDDDNNFLYRRWPDKNNTLASSLGNKIAAVTADPKAGVVKGSILNYQESSKERILDFVFTQPLHFILARHGLFFLHGSVVSKGRDCILITGPQHSGKSTLALTLSQDGFSLLTDDDCFVKLSGERVQLFPFSTKIGLNDKTIKRYPDLNKYTLKNYRYGGKRRISLMHIPSSSNIKGLRCKTIIFPRYKENRSIYMKKISQEEALCRLSKESAILYQKEEFKKIFAKNFWTIYNLTRQADCFELLYNDNNLDKIAGSIKKSGNFED